MVQKVSSPFIPSEYKILSSSDEVVYILPVGDEMDEVGGDVSLFI